MEILKLGSKGDSVKTLQKKLGITADGSFGPMTEKAVKEFQTKNKLDADGIVGPATWGAMFPGEKQPAPSTSSKCVDPSVIYDPLTVHISKAVRTPKYIAIHYTAGGSSKPGSAKSVKHVFEKRDASADFAVDDRDMVQFNPDILNYYCWSVGDKKNPYSQGGSLNGIAGNRNTISIEMCSNLRKGTSGSAANHDGWSITEETFNNTLKLTKILMKKFNIDKNHVVRHYDVSGKLCPGVPGWNNEGLYDAVSGKKNGQKNNSKKWEEFKSKL